MCWQFDEAIFFYQKLISIYVVFLEKIYEVVKFIDFILRAGSYAIDFTLLGHQKCFGNI